MEECFIKKALTQKLRSDITPIGLMARHMFWRNLLLHPTRNSPRQTNKYYYRFIELIGRENWDALDPIYKSAWNNARNSFDKMYGLAAAWKHKDFTAAADAAEKAARVAKALADADTLLRELADKQPACPAPGSREARICACIDAFIKDSQDLLPQDIADDAAPLIKQLEAMQNTAADIRRMQNVRSLCRELCTIFNEKENKG